ncbi:MAG: hypothetical protein FWE12_00220 [Oscillospiraceae bacterium]|nr:hypothetical protein [Oscillospiraceae bacterium]
MVSFDFESFKEKALATAGKVADKSVALAKTAGEKAKVLGKITKLKTEIAMEKDTVRKNFAEIGKMYYEKHKDNPDPDMAQAILESSASLEAVAAKQAEIELLKKDLADKYDAAAEKVDETIEDIIESVVDDEADEDQ